MQQHITSLEKWPKTLMFHTDHPDCDPILSVTSIPYLPVKKNKKCLASLNIQCILGFLFFYFILHPLRLLGACVFLQQTLFFLSRLVHDHLWGFTPASQIRLCPCLLCDYLGSVPTPPKIAQQERWWKNTSSKSGQPYVTKPLEKYLLFTWN